MEIKKFKSIYGLELIAASHAGLTPGDLVWEPLVGPPRFAHPGMPAFIGNAFLDAGLMDEEEFISFKKTCSGVPLVEAKLADKQVDVNSELITDLQHPVIGNLEGRFKLDTISKFNFGELQVREMNDLLRVRIDRYLEIMKEKKWKEYDGRIRRVSMITELYYGSISLILETSLSSAFESALAKSGITAASRSEDNRSVAYSFNHQDVPFAMRIEKIRQFNG